MRALTLALVAGFCAVMPALADDNPAVPTDDDRQVLDDCLAQKSDAAEPLDRCIGAVSDPCLDTPGNDSTPMMGACLDKEATLWDEKLNGWYRHLMGLIDDEQKAGLKDSQRAWITTRDSTCAFEASLWGGGTGAGPAAIGCFMRETGRRALFLKDQIAFVGQ